MGYSNKKARLRGSLIPQDLRESIEDIQESMTGLYHVDGSPVDIKNTGSILAEALLNDRVRLEIMTFVEDDYSI